MFSTRPHARRSASLRPRPDPLEARLLLAVDFDYAMADRFGLDLNRNGIIDLPNTAQYAQAPTFALTLSVDGDPSPDPTVVYRWQLQPPTGGTPIAIQRKASAMAANPPVLNLPQGTYATTFRRLDQGRVTDQVSRAVTVRDILIVSLGDSYASGEANPEQFQGLSVPFLFPQPDTLRSVDLNTYSNTYFQTIASATSVTSNAVWGDAAAGFYGPGPYDGVPGHESMEAEHRDAHRSTLAATAQYALQLERSDPHSSVTYVSVAQSGATTLTAMGLDTNPGKETGAAMPNQLDEIRRIAGARPIDQLFISLGGNDVQFAPIAQAIVSFDIFSSDPVGDTTVYDPAQIRQTLAAALSQTQQSSDVQTALGLFNAGAAVLPTRYQTLNALLPVYGIRTNGVFITQYPDPTRIDQTMTVPGSGQTMQVPWWGPVLFDVAPGFGANATTAYVVSTLIAQPLDGLVQAAAAANGWTMIGGIADAFVGHGYDAPKSGTADTTRFIRTSRESVILQGPVGFLTTETTTGTLHPNALGHQAIAAQIFGALAPTATVRAIAANGLVTLRARGGDARSPANQGLTFAWDFGRAPGSGRFRADAQGRKVAARPRLVRSTATLRITNRLGVVREVAVDWRRA